MSLLPSNEEIRRQLAREKGEPEPEKPALDWNLLLTNSCPICGNILQPSGKLLACTSTRVHERPFRIAAKKVATLKAAIATNEERARQRQHFRSLGHLGL